MTATLEGVLGEDVFKAQAAELLNRMSAVQGRIKVAMVGEGIPHPTWVLEQLMAMHGDIIRMRHREYLMMAMFKSLLAVLDTHTEQTTVSIQTFRDALKTEMQGYMAAMATAAQNAAADALKAQLTAPMNGDGLILPMGARG